MSKKRKRDQNDGISPAESFPTAATPAVDSKFPVKSRGQSRQEKSERRSKKRKQSKEQVQTNTQGTGTGTMLGVEDTSKRIEVEEDPTGQDPTSWDGEQFQNLSKGTEKSGSARAHKKKTSRAPARFIVFVGNLPFDATATQVKDHFSKLAPSSVRLSTDRATGKCKGFAFLEFDAFDKMKTCLKLYHHSIFDVQGKTDNDEPCDQAQGKKRKGRRINVELTAGGGGKKSQERKARIEAKNRKLDGERQRRGKKGTAEQEKAGAKKEPPGTGANAAEATEKPQDDRGAIHPSRLSRVK
ncbi:uncharacterized protein Z518_07964 [Rhinocladiella mackenziei CBS 650.93]|uniref:RRM domain-containing protein n=1 Tax=Rhinocladiella mackenziei CBS 650.93 TaxID=1442369 RepID=A0A0D2IZJ0_9EURO|nr:uncharacterized protein Z518_07964 [Rhinocladiella mackenziei CBS 650.93]KIX02025.1 hypothetical protein Z518_07964 [Rhinocladiella mackenziei CBS 650.93]